jgi:hypothetical protein
LKTQLKPYLSHAFSLLQNLTSTLIFVGVGGGRRPAGAAGIPQIDESKIDFETNGRLNEWLILRGIPKWFVAEGFVGGLGYHGQKNTHVYRNGWVLSPAAFGGKANKTGVSWKCAVLRFGKQVCKTITSGSLWADPQV